MQIIPTILTSDTNEWIKQLIVFSRYFRRIQLDIADGKLVSNKSLQIEDIVKILQTRKLRLKSTIQIDIHLMVVDFLTALKEAKKLNNYLRINTILINSRLEPQLKSLTIVYPDFTLGLDIDSNQNIREVIKKFELNRVTAIQIMTVVSGKQGNAFIPKSLDKIDQLRQKHYKGIIMVDGGINDTTLPIVIGRRNLPDFVCVGSYFTQHLIELKERINKLNSFIMSATNKLTQFDG